MYRNDNLSQEAINQALSAFLLTFLAVIGVILVIAIIFYILKGVGVMKMAQRVGIKNGGLAFVPIIGDYILYKVAFENSVMPVLLLAFNIGVGLFVNVNSSSILWSLQIGTFPFGDVNIMAIILLVLYAFFVYYTLYKVYKKFSNKAVLMTVFTVLTFAFLSPIFLFAIRNNEFRNEAEKN